MKAKFAIKLKWIDKYTKYVNLNNQENFNYSIHNIKEEYRQFISHIYSGDFANDQYMNLTLYKIEEKMKSVSVLLRLLEMSNNDNEKNIEKLCCRSLKSR